MIGINLFTNNYSVKNNSTNSLFGNSSGFSLGEYGLIRSGAYKKVVKSYYGSSKKSGILSAEEKNANKIAANGYMTVKTQANNLKTSLTSITSKLDEVFTTKEVDGKATFDSEKALKSVKDFVTKYNELIDTVADSDDNTILRNGVWMTGEVAAYSKALSEVGISVGSDNKLSIDETDFAKADVDNLKTLFSNKPYSFAGSLISKATTIASQSTLSALRLTRTGGSIYTKSATYNTLSTGAMIDTLF